MLKIKLGNVQVISNFTDEQLEKIKEDLTLDNPKYKQAKKFSKWNNTKIPKYLYFYHYDTKTQSIIAPIGYKPPFNFEIVEDYRDEVNVSYPPIRVKLRDTQVDAFNSYLDDPSKGLICMPTGKGKSILGIYLAYRLKQKALVIVHKDDLVVGWKKDIEFCFDNKVVPKLIKAKKREIGDQITIATVQTLNRLSEEELEKIASNFGMVIIDECLAKDTLITLGDGGFKTIDSIKNADNLLGGKVSNKFSRLSTKYVVHTSTTRLEGSPTHPTWVWSDDQKQLIEKPLKDIKVGDYIPNLLTLPHTTKNNWTAEQLSLVALIQTDGHIDKNPKCNRVKVNVSKDFAYYSDLFTNGVKAFGDFEVKKSFDIRGNMTLWCNDPKLKDILTNTFDIPVGKKSTNLIINEEIQYAPLSSIKAYIETLFSIEGDLNLSKSARLNIGMCSKQFIQGLSLLLRKFSIISNYQVITRKNENHNTLYRLSLSGHFFNKFMDNFSLIPRKYTPYRNLTKSRGKYFEEYYMTKVTKSYATNEEIEVFDFTTTSHSFIANGVKTHNCHHCPSSTYGVIEAFSSPYKIGLSATPERKDGLTPIMNFYLGDFAFKFEYIKEDKDILPVEIIRKDSPVVYEPTVSEKLSSSGNPVYYLDPHGDIKISSIPINKRPRVMFSHLDDLVVKDPQYTKMYIKDIKHEYEEGHSILVLVRLKDHCRYIKEQLEKYIPSEDIQLYYGDSKEPRATLMKRAEDKRQLITIATLSVATEGTNVKQWEVEFLISSINDGKNVEQAIGRIRRTTNKPKLKKVRVYDYRQCNVYSMASHSFTRDSRYRKLKLDNPNAKRPLFSRGYRKN